MTFESGRFPANAWLLAITIFLLVPSVVGGIEPMPKDIVIDEVSIPFNQTIDIVGKSSSSHRFSSAIATIIGLRVEERATQESIRFDLYAQTNDIAELISNIKFNAFYKVRGQIVGAKRSGLNSTCNFSVERIEEMPATVLTPADFIGRIANFEGIAVGSGEVEIEGTKLKLLGVSGWPDHVKNKAVGVRGSVDRTRDGYELSMPTWRLLDLADQVDQDVSLDGTLWSLNSNWWFSYRNEDLYLISKEGPQINFNDDHGRAVSVTGRLVRQLRPSLDQITLKADRDLVPTYVIRDAELAYLEDAIEWSERFGPIYSCNKISDGLPELIAEHSYRRNLFGIETQAMLYEERNEEAINWLLHEISPETTDIIAQRMNNTQLESTLRLLYATILARVNDDRGREFLKQSLVTPGEIPIKEIYYCLGRFPFIGMLEGDEFKTDYAWAEEPLISIMSTPETADSATRYSSIALVLSRINSPAAKKVLLDFVLRTESDLDKLDSFGSFVTDLLVAPSTNLSAEELLRIEAVAKDERARRTILRALLHLKHPAAADRFLEDLENDFVYMDIRDVSSLEVLDALKLHLPKLTGKSKSNAQMLLILGNKDPIPELLSLLNDPEFPDKTVVAFELARLADVRVASPLAQVLRECPEDYFVGNTDVNASAGIMHALEAIAATHSRNAVRELIDLLETDLGRLGGYIDRQGYQRIVAAHLIEITGESFGIEQTAWRKWESAQFNERFHTKKTHQNMEGSFGMGPDRQIDMGR